MADQIALEDVIRPLPAMVIEKVPPYLSKYRERQKAGLARKSDVPLIDIQSHQTFEKQAGSTSSTEKEVYRKSKHIQQIETMIQPRQEPQQQHIPAPQQPNRTNIRPSQPNYQQTVRIRERAARHSKAVKQVIKEQQQEQSDSTTIKTSSSRLAMPNESLRQMFSRFDKQAGAMSRAIQADHRAIRNAKAKITAYQEDILKLQSLRF